MRAIFETVKKVEAAARRRSLKKICAENFTKFIRKNLRRSSFFDKVADWKPATLSKTGSSTGVFQ